MSKTNEIERKVEQGLSLTLDFFIIILFFIYFRVCTLTTFFLNIISILFILLPRDPCCLEFREFRFYFFASLFEANWWSCNMGLHKSRHNMKRNEIKSIKPYKNINKLIIFNGNGLNNGLVGFFCFGWVIKMFGPFEWMLYWNIKIGVLKNYQSSFRGSPEFYP